MKKFLLYGFSLIVGTSPVFGQSTTDSHPALTALVGTAGASVKSQVSSIPVGATVAPKSVSSSNPATSNIGETVEERRERGLKVAGEMMGEQLADNMRVISRSDRFGSGITKIALDSAFADGWGGAGLSRRDRSLVILGVLIAMRETKQLKTHTQVAIVNGLTVRELEQVLIQSTPYVGLPAGVNAMTAMIDGLHEIGKNPDAGDPEKTGP